MALRYGFFDSEITGYDEEGMPEFDRAESSDFVAMFLSCLIRSGVLAVPGDCFQVIAGEGMAVKVRPGFGVIEGRLAYDDEEAVIDLEAADTQNRRIDRVILRANYPDRKCEVIVRAGVPATDPQPPGLLRDGADHFELCLAEVAVRAHQTAVIQADITDTRADTAVCGWVTQNIDQVDTHTLFLQWQDAYQRFYADSSAEFNTWLDRIKEQLGDSVVGTLTDAINALGTDKADKVDVEELQKTVDTLSTDKADKVNVEELQKTMDALDTDKADKVDVEKLQKDLSDKADKVDVEKLQRDLSDKAGKAKIHSLVLTTVGWSGSAAPYSQTVTVSGVTASSIVDIDVTGEVTAEQLDAYISAKIVDGGQGADTITLKAFGEKPAVAIPVKIVVGEV